MWTLTKNGTPLGYHTKTKQEAYKYKRYYIEEHLVAESAALQLRLWTESKKTMLQSEAELIALDTLEEQIKVEEVKRE
jgi:hypothetical protein